MYERMLNNILGRLRQNSLQS